MRGVGESFDKMKKLPLNSPVWLLGKYKHRFNIFSVFDCGIKEDFPYPNLLE